MTQYSYNLNELVDVLEVTDGSGWTGLRFANYNSRPIKVWIYNSERLIDEIVVPSWSICKYPHHTMLSENKPIMAAAVYP